MHIYSSVRTLIIKFVEMIVLTHSAKTEVNMHLVFSLCSSVLEFVLQLSEVPKNLELDVSLDMVCH